MDIILHIGTEKTGTSTIQSVIKSNKEWSAENSMIVPYSLRPNGLGDNQIVLPAMICQGKEKASLRTKAGQYENEADASFDKRIRESFENEILLASKSGINKILISSEHFSSKLRTILEIRALADWLERYGRVKKVIVYLRRQDEFLISSYSTYLKSGRLKSFNMPSIKRAKHRYDYKKLLTLWGGVFGNHTLVVRPFERTRFINQDLIDDFAYYAGLKYGVPERSNDKNLSLDPKSLAILLRYNQWALNVNYDKEEEGRKRLVRLLEELSSSERMTISGNKAMAFMERYAEGNAWVAKNFLQESESLFSEDIDISQKASMRPQTDVDDLFPFLMHALFDSKKI